MTIEWAAASTASDEELLAAVTERRPGAWLELHRRFERVIVGCVRNALRRYRAFATDEDIEDIVAMVLLQLVKDDYRKLRTYDAGRGYRLSSWLGLIATNTALDALRRRPPPSSSLDDESGGPSHVPDRGPSPVEVLERRRQWEALAAAVEALAPADRKFLALYYDEELEPEEIAARLGIAVATVYSRKNKLREKLRRIIEGDREGS